MGHAGAIVAGGKGTAADKYAAFAKAGVRTVKSPAELGSAMNELLRTRRASRSQPAGGIAPRPARMAVARRAKPPAKKKTKVAAGKKAPARGKVAAQRRPTARKRARR
jgi:hypothetical protein